MSEVKSLVWFRIDAWETSCYYVLVKKVEECAMEDGFSRANPNRGIELKSVGWRFNSMVHSGTLRAAMRAVTNHDPGGLYTRNDVCTKTGHWMLDVHRKKHLDARIPK
jgi:hypothetical protein